MPELPEVEVIVRQLIQTGRVLHNPVCKITFFRSQRWIGRNMAEVECCLKDQSFKSISRRGKHILLALENGATLVIHLRMTGKLLWSPDGGKINAFTREIFHFQDGSSLQFNDSRTLGRLYLLAPAESLDALEKLGIEPLSPAFSEDSLRALLAGCNLEIKDFLMNQQKISGIGNIYASEICFRCGIHPLRRTTSLSAPEITRLAQTIPTILQQAIDHKGTTVLNYRTAENKTGEFQRLLQVYGREGQTCVTCGTEIQRFVQKQRSTYFCPTCQK